MIRKSTLLKDLATNYKQKQLELPEKLFYFFNALVETV